MDLIVNLYEEMKEAKLKDSKIRIIRPLAPMNHLVLNYIKETFNDFWASEASVALHKDNPSIFIAL